MASCASATRERADEVWPRVTTNLVAPGVGSLMAGRKVGYPQTTLTLAGLILTLAGATHFIAWFFQNRAQLQSPEADPVETLLAVWLNVRWALLGMGLFLLALLWALTTSYSIYRQARREARVVGPPPPPPE